MIFHIVIFFLLSSLLFFIVSLLTKKSFIFLVVFLNILFLGTNLISYIQIVGQPIPTEYNIPLFQAQDFTYSDKVKIKTYFHDDNLYYFLVNDNSIIKFVTVKNTPEFQTQLNKALMDSEDGDNDHSLTLKIGKGGGMGSFYGADITGGGFGNGTFQQGSHYNQKELPSSEGIEQH